MYYTYIAQCNDDTLYTGITTDVARREKEHNGILPGGARYTRTRRPVSIVYVKEFDDRARASQEEHRIKKLTRVQKNILIQETC